MAVYQVEIEFPVKYATSLRPYQQDPVGLAPAHFVSDGESIIILIQLDDLGFHTDLRLN
jgi:hypothetical protein